jgi:hypothetical protein
MGEEDVEDNRSYAQWFADSFDTWTFKLYEIRSGTYTLHLPEKQYGDKFNEPASKVLYSYCKEKWFWTPTLIRLLEIGADPNYVATDDYCNTPLHLMARKARWLGFLYLVQAGADVNAVNTLMQTPLILACDSDIAGPRLRIIDIILKQPGAVLDARDAGGTSALGAAVFKNNIWIGISLYTYVRAFIFMLVYIHIIVYAILTDTCSFAIIEAWDKCCGG